MTQAPSILVPADIVEQHDGYTIRHFAPVQIGATTFTVREQSMPDANGSIMWITGPRGADYTLEPYRPSDGLYIAQSFTSGQPMRRAGNVVLIRWIGDVLEQA